MSAQSKLAYTLPRGCDFSVSGSEEERERCFPEILSDDFRGIAINGPAEVFFDARSETPWGGFTYLPVYVRWVMDAATEASLAPSSFGELIYVAVDLSTHRPYIGVETEPGIPDPILDAPEPLAVSELSAVVFGGDANPNLADHLGLPKEEARYAVYAMLGEYTSNVLTLCVKKG